MRQLRRVAGLVLLTVACSKGDSRASDSAAAPAAAQTPARALVAQQRPPGPGALTKPIADYTGDELFALMQSLQYAGPNERARRAGPAGNQTTRVRVEGVVNEDSTVLGAVPQFGVIVSRGRNLGSARESLYGMLPGARYTYLLIVLPGTGNTARWQIEQLDVNGNARSHSSLATGTFVGCDHRPWVRGAAADFRTCADSTVRPASMFPLQGGDPPWWVKCEEGCCIAQMGDQG